MLDRKAAQSSQLIVKMIESFFTMSFELPAMGYYFRTSQLETHNPHLSRHVLQRFLEYGQTGIDFPWCYG